MLEEFCAKVLIYYMYWIYYYLPYLSLLQYIFMRTATNAKIHECVFDSLIVKRLKRRFLPLLSPRLLHYTVCSEVKLRLEHFSRQYHNSASKSLQVSNDLRKWSDHFSSWKSTNWLDSNSAKWILYCSVLYSYNLLSLICRVFFQICQIEQHYPQYLFLNTVNTCKNWLDCC